MTRSTWLYSAAMLALVLALGGAGNIVSTSRPDTLQDQTLDSGNTHQSEGSKGARDGMDQLPQNMLAVSYSALLLTGDVKPVKLDLKADPNAKFQPRGGSFSPLDNVHNKEGEHSFPIREIHPLG